MAGVSISYKSTTIATLDDSGSKTLSTGGKYCERDIIVDYVAPALENKTVTPTTSAQTITPGSGYEGLSSVTVNAIPSDAIGSGITKKSAQTYTPTTSNQVIAAGQYLNGAQTILGSTQLVAANIKKGITVFGVTGTYEGNVNVLISSTQWSLDSNNILCM